MTENSNKTVSSKRRRLDLTKILRRKRGGERDIESSVEEELTRLRQRLWRARGRRSRMAGTAFLIVSGVFLFLAYITRYIVFEVTSILALLLGVIFIFTAIEPYVKMNVANRMVVSPLIPLASLLNHLKVNEKAIHIPPPSEQHSNSIFIRAHSQSPLPTLKEIKKMNGVVILDKGVLLPPVGSALLQLYEEELGNLRNIDLDYILEWLPRVMVEHLKIAEKMEMNQKADEIHTKLKELAFRYVCQHSKTVKIVCETTGCPVCSSIAEAIAKNTGQITYYLECNYDPLTRETNIVYKLGPSLDTLKKEERNSNEVSS